MGEKPVSKQAEQPPLSLLPTELESSEEGLAANSCYYQLLNQRMSSSPREWQTCKDSGEVCSALMGERKSRLFLIKKRCQIDILLAKLFCSQILPELL